MRLVVVSDSHGSRWNLFEAIEREPSADVVYFLGDGYREFEAAESIHANKKAFIGVNGNCDFGCTLPAKDIRNLEGVKIYATHGYAEKVKFGLWGLEEQAKNENCSLVLFGHTHQPLKIYKDGVHYFNPGSIREGFYGVVDITPQGVMCINKNI
ncbi:MAG: YfcE family phosphodiesterase [Clostridia bacterium]|nr:YfcE family phosphodiesterase [Clostridia bacterium]